MPDKTVYPMNMEDQNGRGSHLVVAPAYRDKQTGALYVHSDLKEAVKPYQEHEHIAPVHETALMGDVESWAAYIVRYGEADSIYARWSDSGLKATLDYHQSVGSPGRSQWTVEYAFGKTQQFARWESAVRQPYIPHRQMVELLEDGQDDIVEPKRAEILDIVRTLRVTSLSTGDTQIRSDGTTNITFNADTQIRGSKAGEAQIPEYALIDLPVIEGHNNDRGNPVRTEFRVRIRVDVDQERRAVFRLTIPDMDERLRVIYQDIADQAQKHIGDDLGIEILRAG